MPDMNTAGLPAPLDAWRARYARTAVHGGLNLQRGQRLIVLAPVQEAAFARHVAEAAYQAGARFVDVLYGDALLVQSRVRHAPPASLEEYATWQSNALLAAAGRGDAVLSVVSPFQHEFAAPDREKLALIARASARHTAAYHELRRKGALQWCSLALPNAGWAQRVLPNEPPARALEELWQVLLEAVRADSPDPLRAWREHLAVLRARCEMLNAHRFAGLHVTGPGTDLTLGLPDGHRWRTAERRGPAGVTYMANLPTEEVFTLPHRERVNGVVTFTRPFLLGATSVVNARLTLREGRVVQAHADQGQEQLQLLLAQDDGAARFGEVALVPVRSPLSRSSLLFHSPLLDENAGSHLALGNAYSSTLAGGEEMTKQDFSEAGGNESRVHVDLVFGSERTDVTGITREGVTEPLMRGGNWCS